MSLLFGGTACNPQFFFGTSSVSSRYLILLEDAFPCRYLLLSFQVGMATKASRMKTRKRLKFSAGETKAKQKTGKNGKSPASLLKIGPPARRDVTFGSAPQISNSFNRSTDWKSPVAAETLGVICSMLNQ